jgi:serine/threonine protein phosphatase 1
MVYVPFKFFSKNTQGRDFVVGDIHGCFSALENLLAQVNFKPEQDRVFSVGDLIDRGNESHRVIEFLNYPWFFAISGNHERMLLEAGASAALKANWMEYNGGAWWANVPNTLQPRIRQVLAQLPLVIEIATDAGKVGIVHADIPTGMPWSYFVQQIAHETEIVEYALWSRHRFKHLQTTGRTLPVSGIDLVIFGHTPVQRVLQTANIYYVDTGAAFNEDGFGKLTLLQIQPELHVHQIDVNHTSELHHATERSASGEHSGNAARHRILSFRYFTNFWPINKAR